MANARSIPRRLAQHVMQSLIVATEDRLGHLLHIASLALEKTMEIEACRVGYRACGALKAGKIRSEMGIEVFERRVDQRRDATGVFELTSSLTTR